MSTNHPPTSSGDAPAAERVELLTMVGPEADRLRKIASAIRDGRPGFSVRLTRLVDDVSTWTAVVPGVPPHEFDDRENATEWASDVASLVQARAVAAALAPDSAVAGVAEPVVAGKIRELAQAVVSSASARFVGGAQSVDGASLARLAVALAAPTSRAALEGLAMPDPSPGAMTHDSNLVDLVTGFSAALLKKLRDAQKKVGWNSAWMRAGWRDELASELLIHVGKGDPLDVAAYCAFAWHHGWSVAKPAHPAPARGAVDLAGVSGLPEGYRWEPSLKVKVVYHSLIGPDGEMVGTMWDPEDARAFDDAGRALLQPAGEIRSLLEDWRRAIIDNRKGVVEHKVVRAAEDAVLSAIAALQRDAAIARTSGTGSGVSAAAHDVLAERRRQMEVEGWTPGHDDGHLDSEMSLAAACYALAAAGYGGDATTLWPWDMEWWRPTTPRRDLVKAGALILAEIERLDRLRARISAEDRDRPACGATGREGV